MIRLKFHLGGDGFAYSNWEAWAKMLARVLECIFPVDFRLAEAGIAMSRRYRISCRDAAVLAAAERMGCDTVHAEDLNSGQLCGTGRVVGPFAEAA